MLKRFENDYAYYALKNGILHITYKNGTHIDLKASIQIVKDRLRIHQDRPLPILCDVRGVKKIDKSARDYLSSEGAVLIKAVVFVTADSTISKIMSTFYLRTNTPVIPTEVFDEVSEGMSFLNNFL
jgi:hypothetical protein